MVTNKPQSRDTDYPFWDNPKDWPSDPPDYVFLARACHEVGRTIFGAKWIASYFTLDDLEEQNEPPDDCDDETWATYERSCDEIERSFRAMRAEVVRMLAQASEAGDLTTALRPKRGGKLTDLEPYFWSTEHVEARFEHCKMSLNDPFRTKGLLPDPCWIFIKRDTLDRLLKRLASNNSLADNKPFSLPRAHRMLLAKQALVTLYGRDGPSHGVTEERCFQDVNKWVRENGEPKGVSKATIRRAKRELREGTKPT
jgi:hypothetical protein